MRDDHPGSAISNSAVETMRYKPALRPKNGNVAQQAMLLDLYTFSPNDIQQIHSYGDIVVPKLDEFVSLFYA